MSLTNIKLLNQAKLYTVTLHSGLLNLSLVTSSGCANQILHFFFLIYQTSPAYTKPLIQA